MAIRTRRLLVVLLTALFLGQTWLVYSDPAGRAGAPLSELARDGRRIWHRHNCQSCHQLYGFGGFLGPDLTNVAERYAGQDDPGGTSRPLAERLATVLSTGSARMPAFHFAPQQRAALAAFFEELGRTGVGQVRVRKAEPPRALFQRLVDDGPGAEAPLDELAARGRDIVFGRGCIDCHRPNGRSTFRATDLTRMRATVDLARLAQVLSAGIPARGMPPFDLSTAEVEAVAAFLAALAARGPEIRSGFESAERGSSGSLSDLPWFEYP